MDEDIPLSVLSERTTSGAQRPRMSLIFATICSHDRRKITEVAKLGKEHT